MDMELDIEKTRDFYNKTEHIWAPNDPWHMVSFQRISSLVSACAIPPSDYVLNAGSGGNAYGLVNRMHHVDIAGEKISKEKEYTIASIENIPLQDGLFDTILCVGTVINYCNPERVISEFRRLLKHGGRLILEFENSKSYEYCGREAYCRKSAVIECLFQGELHRNFVFLPEYIETILAQNGFSVRKKSYFHILSTWALHLGLSEKQAAIFAVGDTVCQHIPCLRTHGGNVFMVCTLMK